MNALFVGGTGNISMAITRDLLKAGHTIYLVNRGTWNEQLEGDFHVITADINKEEEKVAEAIKDMTFDVVADFIVFTVEQAERDFRLFNGKCKQYMVFSSASAYQKPLSSPIVSEATPVANPFWQYSRNKIAMEEFFMQKYRECGFPFTVVRPSHTYSERYLPLAVGDGLPVIKRMLAGKPIIVHGDGLSLWCITYNTDFAKAFIGLMGNIHAIGETYHITSDESVTWNQIYEIIADELGVKANLYHVSSEFLAATGDDKYGFTGSLIGDKANSAIFDNTKLKRAVPDFVATVRADQGLREAVRYHLAHPEQYKENPEFDAYCDAVIAALEEAKEKIKKSI